VCFVFYYRASLFVFWLVFVYGHFVFVVVWLSVPMQLIAWKDLSPKWHVRPMCRVPYSLSHSVTIRQTMVNSTTDR